MVATFCILYLSTTRNMSYFLRNAMSWSDELDVFDPFLHAEEKVGSNLSCSMGWVAVGYIEVPLIVVVHGEFY
jgi:hypothetical protein